MGQHHGSALPVRRHRARGGPLTYVGTARRIFTLRRRANSLSQEVALTAVSVVLVSLAWTLLTVRNLISWILSASLERRPPRHGWRDRLLGEHGFDRHREQLRSRATIAGSELLPAIEAVSEAWHRGKHTAGEQTASSEPSASELIGDQDRELTAQALQHHLIAGRITVEELENRLGIVHAARTRADLDSATVNLPRRRSS